MKKIRVDGVTENRTYESIGANSYLLYPGEMPP